ncbi:MAG: hypothetical protein MRY83_08215 [Flavobacteriales bacterium]|nr:hypothetical protein [Flavobacteriales bacterium]
MNEEQIDFHLGTIDFSNLQIITISMKNITLTPKAIKELFDTQDLVFRRAAEKFVLITDTTALTGSDFKGQVDLAHRSKALEKKYKGRFIKNYIVISNPIVRVMLQGINILSAPIVPQVICHSYGQAYDKARLEISTW